MSQNPEVRKRVEKLAIMCLYVLTRKAVVNFPGTSRGSPSLWVVVELGYGKPLREADRVFFPMKIPWDLWNQVIVPVVTVKDPNFDLGIEFWTTLRDSLRMVNNMIMLDPEWEILIGRLIQALGLLMEDQGFIPKGSITG